MTDNGYKMKISLSVLELLGKQLYSNIPKCVSEAVANSWDADAEEVKINLDREDSTIEIIDDGHGMNNDSVNDKYLNVGYRRRQEDGDLSKEKERVVMGRKGVGKLSLFGIADTIEVYSKQEESEPQAFEINAKEIREKIQNNNPDTGDDSTIYEPDPISEEKFEEIWPEDQERGTVLRLTELDTNIVNKTETALKKRIARRFSVLGRENFDVIVNGDRVQVTDRDYFHKIEYLWIIGDPDEDYREFCNEDKLEGVSELDGTTQDGKEITGWIGSAKKPSKLKVQIGGEAEETDDINKIHLIVRGKMAKEDLLPEAGGSKYFTEYLCGDIHADFLDDSDDDDIHTTNREDFDRESPRYRKLLKFLSERLDEIDEEWDEYREERKMEQVRELDAWEDRIQELPNREKSLAKSYLKKLAGRENIQEEDMTEAADMVANNIELRAFQDLMTDILDSDVQDSEQLVQLFKDWEIFDAMETLRIAQGRLANILKFEDLIEENAREVPDLHDHLVDNPWLLDPTWDYVQDEEYLSQKLKEKFPEEELEADEGRIDILCLTHGNTLNVVELKRPETAIGMNQLNQIERYVDWLEEFIAEGDDDYRGVDGYVIGSHMSQARGVSSKAKRLRNDGIYVRTFGKLKEVARSNYDRIIEVFERKAERTDDDRLRRGIEQIREIGMADDVDEDFIIETEETEE